MNQKNKIFQKEYYLWQKECFSPKVGWAKAATSGPVPPGLYRSWKSWSPNTKKSNNYRHKYVFFILQNFRPHICFHVLHFRSQMSISSSWSWKMTINAPKHQLLLLKSILYSEYGPMVSKGIRSRMRVRPELLIYRYGKSNDLQNISW